MTYKRKPYPHARQTPARRAWLERLEGSPAIRTEQGLTAFHCMRLGWTEYRKREPNELWPREQLTAEGRRILAEWRANDDAPPKQRPPVGPRFVRFQKTA